MPQICVIQILKLEPGVKMDLGELKVDVSTLIKLAWFHELWQVLGNILVYLRVSYDLEDLENIKQLSSDISSNEPKRKYKVKKTHGFLTDVQSVGKLDVTDVILLFSS